MACTQLQQTARYVCEYPNDVSPEEREAIDVVLGYDRLADDYNPLSSDDVKNWFNWKATDTQIADYRRVWVAQGLRHPDAYLQSVFSTSFPYLSTAGNLQGDFFLADEEHGCTALLHRPECLSGIYDASVSLYGAWLELPVLSWLMKAVLYCLWLPCLCLYCCVRTRSCFLPFFVPVLLSLAACVVGPLFLARYALPLVFTAPLMVGLIFVREAQHVRGRG